MTLREFRGMAVMRAYDNWEWGFSRFYKAYGAWSLWMTRNSPERAKEG